MWHSAVVILLKLLTVPAWAAAVVITSELLTQQSLPGLSPAVSDCVIVCAQWC